MKRRFLGKAPGKLIDIKVFPFLASLNNPHKIYKFEKDELDFIHRSFDKYRWIYSCSKLLMERVIHACGIDEKPKYSIDDTVDHSIAYFYQNFQNVRN